MPALFVSPFRGVTVQRCDRLGSHTLNLQADAPINRHVGPDMSNLRGSAQRIVLGIHFRLFDPAMEVPAEQFHKSSNPPAGLRFLERQAFLAGKRLVVVAGRRRPRAESLQQRLEAGRSRGLPAAQRGQLLRQRLAGQVSLEIGLRVTHGKTKTKKGTKNEKLKNLVPKSRSRRYYSASFAASLAACQ